MSVKLLTEHHLEFLSLRGGCTGLSESTLAKMPHCWKSRVTAHLSFILWKVKYNIRIHQECEGGIENSVPRITDWHHVTCRVMANGYREGQIFLSNPNSPFNTTFYAPQVPEYAEVRHGMMTSLYHNNDVTGRPCS